MPQFRFDSPVALLSVTCVATLAWGADLDTKRLAQIRPRMQQFVERQSIAGAVTLVGRRDSIAHHEAIGIRNRETGEPMQKDTLFRIASMTKPITAIGIMILADESRLAVDDPVEKHLPEFRFQMLVTGRTDAAVTLKKPSRPITIRDLLTHTSGLPSVPSASLADIYLKRDRSLAEAVLVSSQQPLAFEPGSKWSYCNAGIDTLGRIIEVASGESFEGFLKRRVFEPLEMTDTTFCPTPQQLARCAVTYDFKGNDLKPVTGVVIGPPEKSRHPIPAGGLYSTAADLARLYQMMLQGGSLGPKRILSAKSVRVMTQVQTGSLPCGFTPEMGFGFGWAVVRKPTGVTEMLSPGSYGHGGAFGTQAWIDPQKNVFVILLIQRVGLPNADASDMRRELQRLAFSAVAD